MSQGTGERQAGDEARRRAAIEMIGRHEAALRRTARRYSLNAEDADDAYQRALEIVLSKAPSTEPSELIRWTQTVTKHEALAVRRSRERLLGRRPRGDGDDHDPVELAPARGDGPAERVERREEVARAREALQALKPAELTALGLLAEGYSYAEIGERTGFSQTKVNRSIAEGRARLRGLIARYEDGTRCRELRPLLSAFCDGEAGPDAADQVREHLRACAGCRATMRAYRRAPRLAAALLPLAPSSRSLLGRLHDLAANLASRLPGVGAGSASAPAAAAGTAPGVGIAALAKLAIVCAGVAGGAACVATGVIPAPGLIAAGAETPAIERGATSRSDPGDANPTYDPAEGRATSIPAAKKKPSERRPAEHHRQDSPTEEGETASRETSAEDTAAIEYEAPPPAPEPVPVPVESAAAPSGGSAAGEFGP